MQNAWQCVFNGEDNKTIELFLKINALLVKNKNHSGARTNKTQPGPSFKL